MYQIISNRATGKTSSLLLLTKEHDGVFVCAYPDVIKEKAWKLGLTGFDIISYSDYLEHKYPYGKKIEISEGEKAYLEKYKEQINFDINNKYTGSRRKLCV